MATKRKAKTRKLNENEVRDLLAQAVSEPGKLSASFQNFHNYSVMNCMFAWLQCEVRGIDYGPIATYKQWNKLGRKVVSGPGSAIWLCQPFTGAKWYCQCKPQGGDPDPNCPDCEGKGWTHTYTRFEMRPHWFVMSQTDGPDVDLQPTNGWDPIKAMETIGVSFEGFKKGNGNAGGYYSRDRSTIGINPVSDHHLQTLIHELAHAVLHRESDPEIDRATREVEAEASTFVACMSLQIGDSESFAQHRGYIQHWLGEGTIDDNMAKRIFTAATKIIQAGLPDKPEYVKEN